MWLRRGSGAVLGQMGFESAVGIAVLLRRTGMKNAKSQSGAETASARPAGVRACWPGRGF